MATGYEEIEALIPLDVLRRGGVDCKTVSITGNKLVASAHGVNIEADLLFEEADLSDADLLMLPGGMPGADNLDAHAALCQALVKQAAEGKMVAAICAAPKVLGRLGLLKGKKATCYPGFEKYLDGADYTADLCTIDGNVTTGKGPAAALPYAYALLEQLEGKAVAHEVAGGMMYLHLMQAK